MPHNKPTFDPVKLRRYPHMFREDIAIWERFLDKHGNDYKGFDYDVKVGKGHGIANDTPPNYARMVDILSKFRIDAVGYKSSSIEIIEVKPHAATTAIGQIFTYVELYKRDFAPRLLLHGNIITDHEIPDILYLTKLFGIGYYVV